ncbi:hypothetical protein ABOM_005696, partial [Aspergillus bombycis]
GLDADISQASGIGLSSEALGDFQELKLKKSYRYILYGLNSARTEIVVLKTSTAEDYDDFIADLPDSECRWAVYDFQFEVPTGGKRNKLVFISWAPETARIKEKMLYAAATDRLRTSLNGIAVDISATEQSEVSYEAGTVPIAYFP